MALEFSTPNVEYLREVLKTRDITARQLSKVIYGDDTHRDIVKEIETKPDVRASTVLKICRALDITMDSLYNKSDTDSLRNQSITGNGIVTNSSNVKINIADLKAENKALKMVIEEKDKRLAEQSKYIEQLGKRLDLALQLGHNTDSHQ